MNKKLLYQSPGVIVFASLCLVICIGTFLLSLPTAQHMPVPLFDTLFTAASATCVTGLFTVPLDHFSPFGHFVIMCLIQIGGLGLITLMLMIFSLFINFGLSTQLMAGTLLDLESWRNIKKLLFFIAAVTLITEFLGTILIMFTLAGQAPYTALIFPSLFHAIASFCNAGIEIPSAYTAIFRQSYLILITTMTLSLIGGLGFITWHEIIQKICSFFNHRRFRFSLHTKIVLYGFASTIVISSFLIWLLEYQHAFASMNFGQSIPYAIFEAITNKSAGFSFIPITSFYTPTILIIMLMAFIGSSSTSTGSGIKMTTFVLILSTIKTALSGSTTVTIQGRRIAQDQIFKAIAICFLGIGAICLTTFLLSITEPQLPFFKIFFEAWSAVTNLGSSMGTTPLLSPVGKLLIMISMIIGRIGSFSLIISLKVIRWKETNECIYPEERIML